MNTSTCMSLELVLPFSGKGRQPPTLGIDPVKCSECFFSVLVMSI